MQEYTDYRSQPRALAATASIHSFNRDGNTTIKSDTDWLAVAVVCILAGWIWSQYNQVEIGNLAKAGKPFFHAIYAILRRLAADLALFVITILAITAELLLECKKTWLATLRKLRASISRRIDSWRPIAEDFWLQYDLASHSHHANLARQRLRALQTSVGTIIRWAAIIGAASVIINAAPTEDDNSLENADVLPYVVPTWVVRARPENRPYEGSSSHYREEKCTCIHGQNYQTQEEVPGPHLDDRNVTEISIKSVPLAESSTACLSATSMYKSIVTTEQTAVSSDERRRFKGKQVLVATRIDTSTNEQSLWLVPTDRLPPGNMRG